MYTSIRFIALSNKVKNELPSKRGSVVTAPLPADAEILHKVGVLVCCLVDDVVDLVFNIGIHLRAILNCLMLGLARQNSSKWTQF
jgi:hypothetical protein